MDITEIEDKINLAETEINLPAMETWQEFVKIVILLSMHDKVCIVSDLQNEPFLRSNFGFIKREFGYHITVDDVREIIREMHRVGSIEPVQYKCECCKDKEHSDILDHATSFKITILGKSFIPKPSSSS